MINVLLQVYLLSINNFIDYGYYLLGMQKDYAVFQWIIHLFF